MVYSLSERGYAPQALSRLSKRYGTPLGGLCFLAACFAILLLVFSTRIVSMKTLIQVPSAAFILTYVGTCAAGIKLLKDSRFGLVISILSLTLSCIILLFAKWAIAYPLAITGAWFLFLRLRKPPLPHI
jgi:amino acid efflux transporter